VIATSVMAVARKGKRDGRLVSTPMMQSAGNPSAARMGERDGVGGAGRLSHICDMRPVICARLLADEGRSSCYSARSKSMLFGLWHQLQSFCRPELPDEACRQMLLVARGCVMAVLQASDATRSPPLDHQGECGSD